MARYFFTHGIRRLGIDIDIESGVIKATLVMTNTTCDTEFDKTTIGGFTTVDEFDGTISLGEPDAGDPWPEGGETLPITGYTATTVPSRRVEAVGTPLNFASSQRWDNGTRPIQAYLLWADVGATFADGVPLVYNSDPSILPLNPAGDSIRLSPSGNVWFYAASSPLPA